MDEWLRRVVFFRHDAGWLVALWKATRTRGWVVVHWRDRHEIALTRENDSRIFASSGYADSLDVTTTGKKASAHPAPDSTTEEK